MASSSTAPADLGAATFADPPPRPVTMGMRTPLLSWHAPLCCALGRILAHPPREAHLFRRVLAHALRYGNELSDQSRDQRITHDRQVEKYPLATFALAMPPAPRPIETTLAWLILEAHLSRTPDHLAVALSRILRGLVNTKGSKLGDTVADCNGPSQLLAKMARLGKHDTALGITGHQTFDALWRDELHAFCASLLWNVAPPDDESESVSPRVDCPGALTENPQDPTGRDPDEGPYRPSTPVLPDDAIHGKRRRHALDWSVFMCRQSAPDLLRSAENVIPEDARERAWGIAIRNGNQALAAGDVHAAEYGLVAALSIEAGLSAKEAMTTGFGPTTTGKIPVVDLAAHALRRPEVLPPNYFNPAEADERWLPTGGDAIFPLSADCCAFAQRLLDLRLARDGARAHSCLLSEPIDHGQLRASARHDYRLFLAIRVASAIGVDAAQRAFGDTFGMSTAPMFYGAYHARDLALELAAANGFAQPQTATEPWLKAADHWLGSRARPRQAPYQQVWDRLKGEPKRPRGRPSSSRTVDDWRRWRDRLAVHFVLATGHRPTRSLSAITLHDFLPRYALAVVSDKVADPAHATRLVCTGHRFVGELEGFVAELRRIGRNDAWPEARHLASSILAGEKPIFSIPTPDGTESVDIRAVLGALDPLWGHRPNLHRHGLCQFLISRKVDPELRYFQMGWLVHAHHATSASAPFPPMQLGSELAEVVDDWLDYCGWRGGHLPARADQLVPVSRFVDWHSRRADYTGEISAKIDALRAEVQDKGRDLQTSVWQRIKKASEETLAGFNATGTVDKPCFAPRDGASATPDAPLIIGEVQVSALLAPFAGATCSAAERHVAAKQLHQALLRTAKKYGVRVYLPEVSTLSQHQVPSPFLPGIGLALAQMDELQAALVHCLADLSGTPGPDAATEMAAITAWSVILHTTCPDARTAVLILKAAAEARHSDSKPWMVRIPYGSGHVVFTGDQAALVGRLVACGGWDTALEALSRNEFSSLGTFIKRVVPSMCPPDAVAADVVRGCVATANIAKVVTLNGADRLVLDQIVQPVAVTAERAASVEDDITIAGAPPPNQPHKLSADLPPAARNASRRTASDLAKVMLAFDPDFAGEIQGAPAKPPAERNRQLKPMLEDALANVGAEPTPARLILEYAWHLLVRGGPRSSGGQAISTIWKTYHHIQPVLRDYAPDESLEDLDSIGLTALCRQACRSSRRKSSRDVLDSLRNFFKYAAQHYQIAAPDWATLYRTYGVPCVGGDPAVVGDAEASDIMKQLFAEVCALRNSDADPAERRYQEVRLIAALLAEASAARPRSIHGLTFADIHLGAAGELIHLRSRGRFASIKTKTAAGYVLLEGAIWKQYAPWFIAWLSRACAGLVAADLDAIPLFQIPGEPIGVRYDMKSVFGPIGALVRWRTLQPRGRTYWFRKRRIRARHLAVLAASRPRARDMATAMRRDGQALLMTPLAWYLSEPAAYSTRDVSRHAISGRASAVAISGLGARQVDGAARASSPSTTGRIAKLLRLGSAGFVGSTLGACPELPRYGGDLSWSSVDRILRDLARGISADSIATRLFIQPQQVQSVADASRVLMARLGRSIGIGASELAPARRTASATEWYRLLDTQDERLLTVAQDWISVASPETFSVGCGLYDTRATELLQALAVEAHGQAVCGEPDRLGRLVFRFVGASGNGRYGAWQTARWALAVAWVSDYRRRIRA